MDNTQLKEYPKRIITIRRSKRKYSIVCCFYLRFLLILFGLMGVFVGVFVICSIKDGKWSVLVTSLPLLSGMSFLGSAWYSILNKGSLVDTIEIDGIKQEIRILHYTLFNQQCNVAIPFEGMRWNILPGGRSKDRLRIFPQNGKRVVICEDTLGWTCEDINKLRSALSVIVKEGHWTDKIR